jgi:hypothetical protein
MKSDLADLLPDEFTALLEAIRRDLRVQVARSADSDRDDSCRRNARDDIRLLEALNPKRNRFHSLAMHSESPASTFPHTIKKQG